MIETSAFRRPNLFDSCIAKQREIRYTDMHIDAYRRWLNISCDFEFQRVQRIYRRVLIDLWSIDISRSTISINIRGYRRKAFSCLFQAFRQRQSEEHDSLICGNSDAWEHDGRLRDINETRKAGATAIEE